MGRRERPLTDLNPVSNNARVKMFHDDSVWQLKEHETKDAHILTDTVNLIYKHAYT